MLDLHVIWLVYELHLCHDNHLYTHTFTHACMRVHTCSHTRESEAHFDFITSTATETSDYLRAKEILIL